MLDERSKALAPWLSAGRRGDYVVPILDMLNRWVGRAMTAQEAQMTVTAYVGTLCDLPLWTVHRACNRFGNGEVNPAEVGEKYLDGNKPPPAPIVRRVAVTLMKPWAEESTRIWMTLRGTVPRAGDDDETRKRVGAEIDAFVNARRLAEDHSALESEARQRGRESSRDFSTQAILAEYRHHGLEPVYGIGNYLTSLSTLKSLGWSIQERPDGSKVLIAPPAKPPSTKHMTEGT